MLKQKLHLRFNKPVSLLVITLFLAFSLLLSNHRTATTQLDVFDEGAHLDYALKLAHGQIPKWDDKLGQESLLIADCAGRFYAKPTACISKNRNPDLYGASGYSYEAQQPPIGYLPYAAMDHFSNKNPISILKKIRTGGRVWTVLSAAVILLLSMRFKLGLLQTAVLSGITLLNPAYINSAGTINNDASALFFGALTLYFVYAIKTNKKVIFYLFGFTLGLTKLLFALLPAALCIVAFYYSNRKRRPKHTRDPKTFPGESNFFFDYHRPLAITIGAAFSGLFWVLFQNSRSIVSGVQVQKALLGFLHPSRPRLTTLISSVNTNFQIGNSYSPSAWFSIAAFITFGILFSSSLHWKDSFEDYLGKTFFVMAILLAVGWNLLIFIQTHFDVGTATRYMIPSLALIGLAATRTPRLVQGILLTLIIVGNAIWLISPL